MFGRFDEHTPIVLLPSLRLILHVPLPFCHVGTVHRTFGYFQRVEIILNHIHERILLRRHEILDGKGDLLGELLDGHGVDAVVVEADVGLVIADTLVVAFGVVIWAAATSGTKAK